MIFKMSLRDICALVLVNTFLFALPLSEAQGNPMCIGGEFVFTRAEVGHARSEVEHTFLAETENAPDQLRLCIRLSYVRSPG